MPQNKPKPTKECPESPVLYTTFANVKMAKITAYSGKNSIKIVYCPFKNIIVFYLKSRKQKEKETPFIHPMQWTSPLEACVLVHHLAGWTRACPVFGLYGRVDPFVQCRKGQRAPEPGPANIRFWPRTGKKKRKSSIKWPFMSWLVCEAQPQHG